MSNKMIEDIKKARSIWMEAIDQSARANLNTIGKMLDLNRQRYASGADVTSTGDFLASQSGAVKDYIETVSAHMEALTTIGTESRDQLTELSQEFTKGMDFSSFFPFGEAARAKQAGSKKA